VLKGNNANAATRHLGGGRSFDSTDNARLLTQLGRLHERVCDAHDHVLVLPANKKTKQNTSLELTKTKRNALRPNVIYVPSLELKPTMDENKRERTKLADS
jgi:hypothetical protein